MSTDAHDRMIEAFQQYFKWSTRLYDYDSVEAGLKARFWLSRIRKEAAEIRAEINECNKKIRKSRKGKPGRPSKELAKKGIAISARNERLQKLINDDGTEK